MIKTLRYSSPCPWRKAYIRCLFNQAKDLLRKGEEEAAGMLFDRLGNILEQWIPDADEHTGLHPRFEFSNRDKTIATRIKKFLSERQSICSGTFDENHRLKALIGEMRSPSNSQNPGESQAPWDLYRRWSLEEARVWDEACFRLLRRLRFFHGLDLDTFPEGAWGPYNQRYNLIQTLRHLFSFNPEWLESYLLLYDSLQSFEKAIAQPLELPE
ncbi:MAG: hypothetical protein ACMUIA_03120 [bacterium]